MTYFFVFHHRLTLCPTETHRSHTRLIVFFWEHIPQAKRRTIFRLPRFRSRNVTILLPEQINLTVRTTTMNVVNWVVTISLPLLGYKSSRKSTMMGRSTEPDICPKTRIWSPLKPSLGRFWFSIARSTLASQRGEEYANQTSDWLGNTAKGMLCKYFTSWHELNLDRYGLAWNPVKAGHVLGASEDMTVCCWWAKHQSAWKWCLLTWYLLRDVNSYAKAKSTIEPTITFKGHTSVVGVRCYLRTFPPAIYTNLYTYAHYRTLTGMPRMRTSLQVLEMIKCLWCK